MNSLSLSLVLTESWRLEKADKEKENSGINPLIQVYNTELHIQEISGNKKQMSSALLHTKSLGLSCLESYQQR